VQIAWHDSHALADKNWGRFCLLVINHGTNLSAWYKMVLHQLLMIIMWTFPTFSSVQPVKGWLESLQSWTKVSPCFKWETTQKTVLPMEMLPKAFFEVFICFRHSFPEPKGKLNTNLLFLHYRTSSHLTGTTVNTYWQAILMVITEKLIIQTLKIAIQQYLVEDSCTRILGPCSESGNFQISPPTTE
jgi:hypothetical protein